MQCRLNNCSDISLKAKHFKLQLSWSRLQPNGKGEFNGKGVQHYNDVIDAYQKAGIHLMVELYHWDLPQALQDLGGWLNPAIIQLYTDYAERCFEIFGTKVRCDDQFIYILQYITLDLLHYLNSEHYI